MNSIEIETMKKEMMKEIMIKETIERKMNNLSIERVRDCNNMNTTDRDRIYRTEYEFIVKCYNEICESVIEEYKNTDLDFYLKIVKELNNSYCDYSEEGIEKRFKKLFMNYDYYITEIEKNRDDIIEMLYFNGMGDPEYDLEDESNEDLFTALLVVIVMYVKKDFKEMIKNT